VLSPSQRQKKEPGFVFFEHETVYKEQGLSSMMEGMIT